MPSQPPKPTILLIRHGEKPPHSLPNLSPQGVSRAASLPHVLSAYNISLILVQKPRPNGKRARPLQTVAPLARHLSLEVDTSHERDDVEAVAGAVLAYVRGEGAGDVLICWEHHRLREIAEAIGAKGAPAYESERYDVLWRMEEPWERVDVTNYSVSEQVVRY